MVDHAIEGKVALITGGAKNLGGLLAIDLAKHGAKAIAIHYHSDESRKEAELTKEAVEKAGSKALIFQADLSREKAVEDLFLSVKNAFGGIDIAINTVGRVLKKTILETTEAEFDTMSAVNSKSAFFFIKFAGKYLNDHGKICSIVTSLLGAYTPYYATYAGLKAPVEQFTRAASKEFADRGISVTAIGPGPMDTPFFYGQETPESVAYLKQGAALSPYSGSGLTEIEHVVPHVRLMVSEGWWMTGQTILINGGFTTK
ncbi:SDR family oxidoreductase [Acetobacteraceae bacterium]|nr:SDR family oxidoreductase [Acetobacteraceae bacterium]